MPIPDFSNSRLLRQALTHSSYAYEHPTEGLNMENSDYERLEFLGDSIIELVVRDLLFARYPSMSEGEMSKRGDRLVSKSFLASLSVQLGIPPLLRLGSGAQHERDNPSVQADAFEAMVGAYRLDAGLDAAYKYVADIFRPLVDMALDFRATDPVSEFQEYVQAHIGNSVLPEYRVLEASGPDHAKVFTLEVWVESTKYGAGRGNSKKEAKKNAALEALKRVKR
ncbi:ribonuclease III [Leptolyngbya sp. KIOST-1]|uniref:ribonuclease III n=1 Tax=Leptolyngbya sp. KIOST-1 TaxID=1229172 RepID=UPI00056BF450|nr:ribonuclease III [Leptolyngbya sp. KIOST-1]